MPRQHSVFIDWMRYTVPTETSKDEYVPMHPAFDDSGEILKSYPNYTSSRAFMCGRADWNAARPEQRLMVTLTGKDLEHMRELGLTDAGLIDWIHDIPGIKFTRVDLAIDTNDTRISPHGIADDWRKGRVETKARKMSEITSANDNGDYAGHTVYIGSRTSEQFLRVYDKAAEQETDNHLTRIELELKGHVAFEAIMSMHRGKAVGVMFAAFSRFFKWPNAGWQDMLSGHSEAVERLSRPDKDGRLQWIRKVALRAVIEAYHAGDPVVRAAIKRIG